MSARHKKAPQYETKAANPATLRLIQEAQQNAQQYIDQLVREGMGIDQVRPEDGWKFDLSTGQYVRPKATK